MQRRAVAKSATAMVNSVHIRSTIGAVTPEARTALYDGAGHLLEIVQQQ